MPVNIPINPSHWANNGCVGWWPVLRDLSYGPTLPAVIGPYDFTIANDAFSVLSGPWSKKLRPGGIGDACLGPFTNGSWKYYATSNFNVGTACPTQGTLAIWVQPTYDAGFGGTQEIFSMGASTTAGLIDIQLNTSGPGNEVIDAGFYINGEYRALPTIHSPIWATGTWTHLLVTWAVGDKCRLYVNGILTGTASSNLPSYSLTGPSLLGTTSWQSHNYYAACYVDDLCIWNYQMSAVPALQVYNDSLNGWQNRLLSPVPAYFFARPSQSYTISATGGMLQGGYPDRTSVWIMPGIGGMAESGEAPVMAGYLPIGGEALGGYAGPQAAFHPSAVGGEQLGGASTWARVCSPPISGGMKDGGKTTAPILAFAPATSGGLTDGGDTAAPLAWDSFTGSSGTLLTAHKSNDGGSWTKHPSYSSGDARLDGSGAVYSTTGSVGFFVHSYIPSSADYVVSLDCTRTGSGDIGVGVRWSSSADTGYYAIADSSGHVYIYKNVTGTQTQLGSAIATWAVNQTSRLTLAVAGTKLNAWWDGALVIGPITDSSISSVGHPCLAYITSNTKGDNWTSTGGGVQAQYVLSGSGGEEFGGAYGSGQIYVMPCSGGVRQGGQGSRAASFAPSVSGGMKDGGLAGPHLLITETASGGVADGGEMTYVYVVIATGGGMATGGERLGPVMDYGPIPTGGLTDGGVAPNIGVYVIDPVGGQELGGHIRIVLGVAYHVYANDGAGGPIDYGTVYAETTGLSFTTDTLTGPAVWSFGVRAHDHDTGLEERNVDAVVTIRLDAAGHDITNIPAPVLALTGHAGKAGTATLSWQYQTSDQAKAPRQFNVYQGLAGGGGGVNYATPVATVPYRALLRVFQATVSSLTDGTTYLFSVRAANATGEEQSMTTVSVLAETSGPSAVIGVSASAVA